MPSIRGQRWGRPLLENRRGRSCSSGCTCSGSNTARSSDRRATNRHATHAGNHRRHRYFRAHSWDHTDNETQICPHHRFAVPKYWSSISAKLSRVLRKSAAWDSNASRVGGFDSAMAVSPQPLGMENYYLLRWLDCQTKKMCRFKVQSSRVQRL